MRRFKTIILTAAAVMICAGSSAQVTERKRPAQWDSLVVGGRFMDRFQPMPQGTLSSHVWGCSDVVPRYVDNGIELPDISFWGGNIIKGDDSLYHLFVCGWPENSPRGHMFWSKSTVFHAVSSSLHGPYKIVNSIGKGHNPEAYHLADGRYLVYVIGGYYTATNPQGPWIYGVFNFNKRSRRQVEDMSNLTFAQRADGSRLMVNRGGGIWISRDGISQYSLLTNGSVYPNVNGEFEDPIVWRDSLQYHLIVNDWLGRIAYYQRSLDGVHWITEPGEAYMPGITRHKDGHVEKWFKYERMKVFQDEYGRVIQSNFAVIDTIKWEDHPYDSHSSKNVCIPMNKGMLLSVLSQKPVDEKTRRIDVLIKGEDGFNPIADVDISSLRFGSYSEVNYGHGMKAVSIKASGKDAIVTFKGKRSGITKHEFAPKMIGKTKDGNMIFGYARMPFVNYNPPILSALPPVMKGDGNMSLEVENFGLSASQPMSVRIVYSDEVVAQAPLPVIQPYGKVTLQLQSVKPLVDVKDENFKVEFVYAQKVVDVSSFASK